MSLQPCQKLWVEEDGRIVMSDYRVRLLQLVAETGSLAQAAARLNLSYRRAWGKVKELEHNFGVRLITSEVGGAGGGQSALTDEGRRFVDAYLRFQERMSDALERAFAEEIGPLTRR